MASDNAMRECPACLEEIRSGASVCKFCRSYLVPEDDLQPDPEVGVHMKITPLSESEVAALNIGVLPENTITTVAKENCTECKLIDKPGRVVGAGTRTCIKTRCIYWPSGQTYCWREQVSEACTAFIAPPLLLWR
jgi:hypothetical protein